jgi:hypothetical protein
MKQYRIAAPQKKRARILDDAPFCEIGRLNMNATNRTATAKALSVFVPKRLQARRAVANTIHKPSRATKQAAGARTGKNICRYTSFPDGVGAMAASR